jgi:hypothetical protein
MKLTTVIFAFIALAGIFVACKRENTGFTSQEPGIVVFPEAGVSLAVGPGWKRIDISAGPPVCPPTLVGEPGIVRAMLFGPTITDMQAATNAVHSMFDGDADAVKDSFHQEAFTTDSGARGQHISYILHTKKNGTLTDARSDRYIVQRKDGRCVAISHIAINETDSEVVHQIVQKSLKLH